MNIFQKSLLKQGLSNELKKVQKRSLMINFNTILIKQFSNKREFTSLINNKTNVALGNFQTGKNIDFYSIKRNNFADSAPRHAKVLMPNLSPHGMTQGKILAWRKKVGDKVNEGDAIASIETDKSVMDFEVNEEGYLAKIIVPADATNMVKVGDLIAIIVEEKDDIAYFSGEGQIGEETKAAAPQQTATPQQAKPQQKKGAAKKLPPHTKLDMPKLSPTMKAGGISTWYKKEGDKVKAGDSLASIETDKAAIDFEMTEDGYLAKILVPEGTKDVELGTLIAIMVEEPEDVEAFRNYTGEESSAAQVEEGVEEEVVSAQPAQPTPKVHTDGRVIASPLARKVAREGQIDLSEIEGTGPNGRIISGDVLQTTPQVSTGERVNASPLARKTARERGIDFGRIRGTGPRGRVLQADVLEAKVQEHAKPTPKVAERVQPTPKVAERVQPTPKVEERVQPTPKVAETVTPTIEKAKTTPKAPVKPTGVAPDYEDLEITSIRRITAERLAFSKSTIPHFYISMDCNTDRLVALRTELNKHSTVKISFNDIVIKAAALACMKVPETNSSWQETFIRKYKNVDMSIAVQTEHGLITPIVTNANLKGLATISKEVKELAEKAKQRKLKPEEFIGGTFTISNMGMHGITNFTAVINPPQSCILAVGKMEKKLVVDENASDKNSPYKVVNVMNVTLSSDHRVVDGVFAAQWVQEFRNLIENPELMLL